LEGSKNLGPAVVPGIAKVPGHSASMNQYNDLRSGADDILGAPSQCHSTALLESMQSLLQDPTWAQHVMEF